AAWSRTRGPADPIRRGEDIGAMITVTAQYGGQTGVGYGATCDVTPAGLARAAEEAMAWAGRSAGHLVAVPKPHAVGRQYDRVSVAATPWSSVSAADKVARLHQLARTVKRDDRITDWQACLTYTDEETAFASSAGDFIREGRG